MVNLYDIYKVLYKHLGPQGWWPITPENSIKPVYRRENTLKEKNDVEKLEISLGAILAQNTTWKNAEKAVSNLKRAGLFDREKLRQVDIKKLAEIIKPAGYYNQKAKKIIEFIRYNGEITRKALLSIWGIGPETADSILLYAYNMPEFVVDAYTKRIFSRLGFFPENTSYEDVKKMFQDELPKNYVIFNEYHALIVEIGKRYCRKKPVCSDCPLKDICDYRK